MSRNIQRSIYAALSIAVAVVLFCRADTCTDEELRHDVLEFLTTRCCGRVEARRVLTNEIRFEGDTMGTDQEQVSAAFTLSRINEILYWVVSKKA